MTLIQRVLQYGMAVEVLLPELHARMAVSLLISPGRTDSREGSSFGYVSGGSNPGLRGLALSVASARFLAGIKPGETEYNNKILGEIQEAVRLEAARKGVTL